MRPETQETTSPVYQTITRGRISLSNLTDTEFGFMEKVAKKYNSRQDWTRFAAWWNAEFNAVGLSTSSAVYRICQDLEARLGINQGKVSPPDYRDFLVIQTEEESCAQTSVDQAAEAVANAIAVQMQMKALAEARRLEQRNVRSSYDQLTVQTVADPPGQSST